MSVDRSHYKTKLYRFPPWPCPTCNKGVLNKDDGAWSDAETGPSKFAQAHDAWDPEWIERRFAGLLVCGNAACGERVAIFGNVTIEEDNYQEYTGEWVQDFSDAFEVLGLSPAPIPISVPDETPEEVRDRLRDASGLIWQSSEASANKLRQAVEHLMDFKRVKKILSSKGKRRKLTLHSRIEEFEKKDPVNSELLLAVKWLGNSGSHAGGLSRKNVLDGFDIIEHVLRNMFDKSSTKIVRKAKAINRKRGPSK